MILMIVLSNLLKLYKIACGLRDADWYNLKGGDQIS